MKKGLTIMMAAFFLALMMGGSSSALPISGSIWAPVAGYSSSTHDLTNGAVSGLGAANATFTVNALNFDSEALSGSYGGVVTYTQFLSNSLVSAPGPNGLIWNNSTSIAFGGQNLITGSGTASIFQFTGNAYFPATFTIRKDDGFVLYVNGTMVIDASGPTAPQGVPVTLGFAPGFYNFTLNYAAWNSFPEVLQAPDIKVPEPMTLLLLGLGMLGVAGIGRKYRS
jgi:hypothetical protein